MKNSICFSLFYSRCSFSLLFPLSWWKRCDTNCVVSRTGGRAVRTRERDSSWAHFGEILARRGDKDAGVVEAELVAGKISRVAWFPQWEPAGPRNGRGEAFLVLLCMRRARIPSDTSVSYSWLPSITSGRWRSIRRISSTPCWNDFDRFAPWTTRFCAGTSPKSEHFLTSNILTIGSKINEVTPLS